jgi:cyanophycinase-like exopeptidase
VSRIVLMGSGETAPAMVKTHRAVIAAAGDGPCVMLDTPYGFQVNADDLTRRTLRYFDESVGQRVVPAEWRRRDLPAADRERVLAQLSQASWLFAGPGSPTYALDQWRDTALHGAIGDVVARGGTVVLGSAAAVTAGRWALPVYEIYKVGVAPYWADGLDLLSRFLNLEVAVVPHFDNAEGGTYDTRFCYLGEERLDYLERQLPDDAAVLGVDEHTALVIDVASGTVEVSGAGHVTVRRHGAAEQIPAGSVLTVTQLRGIATGVAHVPPSGTPAPLVAEATAGGEPPSLDREVQALRADFDDAMSAGEVDGAVAAVLALDDSIAAWSADTLQSDALDQARRELRAMVVRLGELAKVGTADPALTVAPLVEAALAARRQARVEKDFAVSDLLRDVLVGGGVTVQDTAEGAQWSFNTPNDEGPGSSP